MELGELAESGVGFGVDNSALFNPADLVFLGLDAEKTAAVLEHFKRLPVPHLGHPI